MATKKGAKKELPTGQGLDPGKTVGKPVVQEPTVEETAVVPGQKEAGNSQPEPERQELPAEDVPLEPERQESSAVDPLPESERQEPPATDPSLEPEEMPHAMAGQGMAEPDPPGEAVLEEKRYRIACRNKVTETIGGVKFVDGVGYTGDGFSASWFANKSGYEVSLADPGERG